MQISISPDNKRLVKYSLYPYSPEAFQLTIVNPFYTPLKLTVVMSREARLLKTKAYAYSSLYDSARNLFDIVHFYVILIGKQQKISNFKFWLGY